MLISYSSSIVYRALTIEACFLYYYWSTIICFPLNTLTICSKKAFITSTSLFNFPTSVLISDLTFLNEELINWELPKQAMSFSWSSFELISSISLWLWICKLFRSLSLFETSNLESAVISIRVSFDSLMCSSYSRKFSIESAVKKMSPSVSEMNYWYFCFWSLKPLCSSISSKDCLMSSLDLNVEASSLIELSNSLSIVL